MYFRQEKITINNKSNYTADLSIEIEKESITYKGVFYMDFKLGSTFDGLIYKYELCVNRVNGEFIVSRELINHRKKNPTVTTKTKRTNFESLEELTKFGFYMGERRKGWGVKYDRIISDFYNNIYESLREEITDPYLKTKTYYKPVINKLYDLIVDYHLDKKGIKGHNNVYAHIQSMYPKKKWLKLNDQKFLPAILDEYEIKSKYLIKELNAPDPNINYGSHIRLKAVIYLCSLFGKHYVDHIRKFDWKLIVGNEFTKPKIHKCKNESEKQIIIRMFDIQNDQDVHPRVLDVPRVSNVLSALYDLMETREYVEKFGVELSLNQMRTPDELVLVLPCWELIKTQLKTGTMMKYIFPNEMVKDIEKPIIVKDVSFHPRILSTDYDFCSEGVSMKNCIGREFGHGIIYIYISLSHGKHKVNLQYRKGELSQSYGKANTPVTEEFNEPIKLLTEKMIKYKELKWEKGKVDI